MQNYRDVVYDSGLYPDDVITRYGEMGAHWSQESWIRREKSLRHDMCVLLLANLTEEDQEEDLRVVKGPEGRPIKYRVVEKDDGTINLIEIYPKILPSKGKRYIVLEGSSVSGLTQNVLASEWKLKETPIGTWDIVDQRARIFIEVKVTVDFHKAKMDYEKKVRDDSDHYALVWFHPTTFKKEFVNCHERSFTGVNKVIDFLGQRCIKLNEAGILVTDSNEDDDLENTIFTSPSVEALVQSWKSKWLDLKAPRMSDEEIKSSEIPTPKFVEISELKHHLEDPSKRDAEIVKYNGKILPESLVFHIYTSEDKDIMMVAELLTTWQEEICTRSERGIGHNIIEEALLMLETKDFEGSKLPILRKYLGVGAKCKIYNSSDETTKIPDKIPPSPLRYHPWMHTMIRDMTILEPDLEGVAFPELLDNESETPHPMEKIAKAIVKEVTTIFCTSLVGHWCQKMKNVYSRIGGVYSNKGDRAPGHNNFAIFPIYSKVATCVGGETRADRRMSGLILRAPDHTRQGSDKINLIVIEMTKSDARTRKYLPYLKNLIVMPGGEYDLVIRQNALMKLDSSYLTFSTNSLFNVTNFIGEMVLFEESSKQFADPVKEGKAFCAKHKIWIRERLAECTFMMIIGGSQEEGLLAMHRMLFMILLNLERGKECFIYNIQGFCNKINECVINKPLAMYFQKCMCDAIEILCEV